MTTCGTALAHISRVCLRLLATQESVSKAKEAVAVDVTDAESWCALLAPSSTCRQQPAVSALRTSDVCSLHDSRWPSDVLGNAYLSTFFSCEHNPEDLSSAMKAYARAVRG